MKYTLLLLLLSFAVIVKGQTSVRFVQSDFAKEAELPFSEVVQVGNMLYLSGQLGNLPGTITLVEGGIAAETAQTMKNIEALLKANEATLDNVIKCTCMLADISEWPQMNEVYKAFFPRQKPARSAFATSGLALGARVEIECLAYLE